MAAVTTLAAPRQTPGPGSAACERCGHAIDERHFDAWGFADVPEPGRQARLAHVELSPQYCGVLEFFAQYTNLQARNPAQVETPGLQWLILVNRQVLDPYAQLEQILNPWGFGSFQLAVRLPEGANVEFVVRRTLGSPLPVKLQRIGGRLAGRYWYDASFGGRLRHHGRAP